MADTAQLLINLAANIVGSSIGGKGAKNQVYYAQTSLGGTCPPHLLPMLNTMVNGALYSKETLLKCATEAGLFSLPVSRLPTGCPPLEPPPAELIVVLYEALLGSRRVRGSSPIVQLVKAHKSELQKKLAARRRRGVEHKFKARVKLPRFVRVNLLKTTVEDTKQYFKQKLGLKFVEPKTDTNTFSIQPRTFTSDPILPDVFVLPSGTNLHGDKQVENGALVLQDRSSCLTAIALSPPPGSVCIDTCASPGNKTLHMASLMRGKGKITAFERDQGRLKTLVRRIGEQGAQHFVVTRGDDAMNIDTSVSGEFKDVTHVLIDPSCSGSGLAAQTAAGTSQANEYDNGSLAADSVKVRQLADHQVELILHAMTLPAVQSIVYSTCSVYREENEDVVLRVLNAQGAFKCAMAIPKWPHRGLEGIPEFSEISPLVCRATFDRDSTNGFFVARFERRGDRDGKKKKRKKRKRDTGVRESGTRSEGESYVLPKSTIIKSSDDRGTSTNKIPPIEQRACTSYTKYGACKKGSRCKYLHNDPEPVRPGEDDVDEILASMYASTANA
jgi:25S rRNA (cytosine2278-C5)-methyltransferase